MTHHVHRESLGALRRRPAAVLAACRHRRSLAARRRTGRNRQRRARCRRSRCRRSRSARCRTACPSGSSRCTKCRSSTSTLIVQVRRGGRPGRQVRRGATSRPPCSTKAPARGARSNWPTPSTFSARRSRTSSSFDASSVRPARARVEARRGAAAHGRRRRCGRRFPQADLDRLRKERLTTLLQTARQRRPQLASVGLLRGCSSARTHRYGTAADGRRGDEHGDDGRRPPGVLRGALPAAERAPARRRRRHGGQRCCRSSSARLAPGRTRGADRRSRRCRPRQQPTARQIYLVDKPGAAQSQIRIGWIGVARNTPDYFVIDVMNTMLGGSFTSRLNQNLREEHGYTYGASSSFDMRATPGPFVARRRRADGQDGRIAAGVLQGTRRHARRRCRPTN